MKIITYKPTSPGVRHTKRILYPGQWKSSPYKLLVEGKRSKAGRNNSGEITMRHRGGGHKRKLRLIELNKSIYSSFEVTRIEYDPNRTAKIALCKILNSNNYFYILASEEIRVGNIYSGNFDKSDNYPKISQRLKFLPTGSSIFNIIGTYAKSAGVNSVLLKNLDNNKTLIRLPSKKILTVSSDSLAQLGRVSNGLHNNIALGKAGASRWRGIRPTVRGVAMNPIDHPHGGKTPVTGGRGGSPMTPWGRLAKWQKKN